MLVLTLKKLFPNISFLKGPQCVSRTFASKPYEIPHRLRNIPDAENPDFFEMVEYFFHRAAVIAEPRYTVITHYIQPQQTKTLVIFYSKWDD